MEVLKKLNAIDFKGKYKSQRSVNDEAIVKCKIPWPHNQVLPGSSKLCPSYDSFSVYQWVTGFARIAHDEKMLRQKTKCLSTSRK